MSPFVEGVNSNLQSIGKRTLQCVKQGYKVSKSKSTGTKYNKILGKDLENLLFGDGGHGVVVATKHRHHVSEEAQRG